tara:strand:+ start:15427 stop:17505 length:2079 start_codon:yes stop_codon:yes gene_type:complete
MKKNYIFTFLLTLCISFLSFGQDLLITGVIDGPLPSGYPKGIELFAKNKITDLSIYGIESAGNGAAAGGVEYTFPNDEIEAGTYFYLATTGSSAGFIQYLGVTPEYENNVVNVNGNDTVILYKNGVVEDSIGVIGENGTNKDWEHLDGWAYRKDGSGPNATFDSSEWIFSGKNALDGCDKTDDSGTNAECSSVFPVGTYLAVASSDPEINVGSAVSGLDYFEGNGPSEAKFFNVEGTNLTSDITISAPTNFEVSLTSDGTYTQMVSLIQVSGSVSSTSVYVRLKSGLTVNSYSGDVSIASTGVTSKTIGLEGEISPADPQFSFVEFFNDFTYVVSNEGPSDEQTFTVEGLFLTTNLVIAAPENYEVSLTSGSGFTSSVEVVQSSGKVEDIIYIRLKSDLVTGNYMGDITLSSTGVADKTIAVNGKVFGAVTNSLMITGVYDATLSGGTPKGVEIYVLKDIADLSLFGISSVANGGGSSAGNIGFSFPSDAVSAGTFIYVSTEATNFETFFGMAPTYTTGTVSINGDDSIELYENGQIIDVFGDVDTDGSGEAWEYLDGWAYRNNNSSPEGTVFTLENWSFSKDGLKGGTNNATATMPLPIGTYTMATASLERNGILGFATYPNPITKKEFTVSSNSNAKKTINIFNVLGKRVLTTGFSGTKYLVDVSAINSGIYILKVTEDGKTATKKLVIR